VNEPVPPLGELPASPPVPDGWGIALAPGRAYVDADGRPHLLLHGVALLPERDGFFQLVVLALAEGAPRAFAVAPAARVPPPSAEAPEVEPGPEPVWFNLDLGAELPLDDLRGRVFLWAQWGSLRSAALAVDVPVAHAERGQS
jgi:hypothetical protein